MEPETQMTASDMEPGPIKEECEEPVSEKSLGIKEAPTSRGAYMQSYSLTN